MELKIDVEKDDGKCQIIFSNYGIDNANYINLITNKEEYLITLDDLEAVINAFKTFKKNNEY